MAVRLASVTVTVTLAELYPWIVPRLQARFWPFMSGCCEGAREGDPRFQGRREQDPGLGVRSLVVDAVADRLLIVLDVTHEIGRQRPPHHDRRRAGIEHRSILQPVEPQAKRSPACDPREPSPEPARR